MHEFLGVQDAAAGERRRSGYGNEPLGAGRGHPGCGGVVLASGCLGSGSPSSSAASAPTRPAQLLGFAAGQGWSSASSGMHVAIPQAPTAWVTNFAPPKVSSTQGYSLLPHLADHPTGVVLIAIVYGSATTAPGKSWTNFPPRSLPLDLRDAVVQRHWEGQPTPHIPQYLLLARVHGYLLQLNTYFATQHPSPSLLATAQNELSTFIPTATSATPTNLPAPPVYIQRYQTRGALADQGAARLSQNSALAVPNGHPRQLLNIRGFGTLTLSCTTHPTGTIRLTAWARGEGPPVIQHQETHPTSPMTLVPYTAAGGPVNLPGHRAAPQTFEYWQITIITSAFSANATILGLITQTGNTCDLSAEATVISHGQFYRYAR
jgi:hypothetical protein